MGDPLWVPKMPPGEVPAGTRSIVYGNYPARSSTHLCSMIFTTRPPLVNVWQRVRGAMFGMSLRPCP